MDRMENLSHTGRGLVVLISSYRAAQFSVQLGVVSSEHGGSRKRAGSKGNRMWDQVHIVIAIPTRHAVFAGDNIVVYGVLGVHRGRGRSGDPQPDPAAS